METPAFDAHHVRSRLANIYGEKWYDAVFYLIRTLVQAINKLPKKGRGAHSFGNLKRLDKAVYDVIEGEKVKVEQRWKNQRPANTASRTVAEKLLLLLVFEDSKVPGGEHFIAEVEEIMKTHLKRSEWHLYDELEEYAKKLKEKDSPPSLKGEESTSKLSAGQSARLLWEHVSVHHGSVAENPPEGKEGWREIGPLSEEVYQSWAEELDLSYSQVQSARRHLIAEGLMYKDGPAQSRTASYYIAPHDLKASLYPKRRVMKALMARMNRNKEVSVQRLGVTLPTYFVGTASDLSSEVEQEADLTSAERLELYRQLRAQKLLFHEGDVYRHPSASFYLVDPLEAKEVFLEGGWVTEGDLERDGEVAFPRAS